MPWDFQPMVQAASILFGVPLPAPAPAPAPVPPSEANAGSPQLHGGSNFIERLLDPEGAADRDRARQQLAGGFSILSEEELAVGRHPTNAVSAREYDDIVRLFSDIRLGRGDLTIDAGYHDARHG